MKTMANLDWKTHSTLGGEQAEISFSNGYGASVLRGGTFYTTGGTYELAVLHHRDITYETYITDDVLGYQTEEEINVALANIQCL